MLNVKNVFKMFVHLCMLVHVLLSVNTCLGLHQRTARRIASHPDRQTDVHTTTDNTVLASIASRVPKCLLAYRYNGRTVRGGITQVDDTDVQLWEVSELVGRVHVGVCAAD